MKFLARIFRRRPDRWAVDGKHYPCNPKCGYAFVKTGGKWWRNPNYAANKDQWTVIGSWEDLEYNYADCSGHLERHYGKGKK